MRLRRALCGLLAFLLMVPAIPAKIKADWTRVEKLPFDVPLWVDTTDGNAYEGRFFSADPDALRLKVRDASQGGLWVRRELPRKSIRRVVLMRARDSDIRPTLLKGQLIGAAGGAVAGGIIAGRAWPIGVPLGALEGSIAGLVVGGAVAVTRTLHASHSAVIYEADLQHSGPHK